MVNSAIRRLQKDFRALQDFPVANANAAPLVTDMFTWHINFFVPLTIDRKTTIVPLHAKLVAPEDYPQNPPNVGFCNDFPYDLGAHFIQDHGPLKDHKIICLNILGNFADYHSEWKYQEGEGWSSAMSIQTILVQLQSLVCQLDERMQVTAKRTLIKDCQKYTFSYGDYKHCFENPWPKYQNPREIRILQKKAILLKKISFLLEEKEQGEFIGLLDDIFYNGKVDDNISNDGNTSNDGNISNDGISEYDGTSECTSTNDGISEEDDNISNDGISECTYGMFLDVKTVKTPVELLKVDNTIVEEDDTIKYISNDGISEYTGYGMFLDGKTPETPVLSVEESDNIKYISNDGISECTLGYGMFLDGKTLKTTAELLSKSVFHHITTNAFTHWVPAFIDQKHISNGDWYKLLKLRLIPLADEVEKGMKRRSGGYPVKTPHPILDILPNIIDSLCVEIMKGDKVAAKAFFEALCSFWRTLRYCLFEGPEAEELQKLAYERLKKFSTSEEARDKKNCPDISQILALCSTMTDKIPMHRFITAYLKESMLRSVMWWDLELKNPITVFKATEVIYEHYDLTINSKDDLLCFEENCDRVVLSKTNSTLMKSNRMVEIGDHVALHGITSLKSLRKHLNNARYPFKLKMKRSRDMTGRHLFAFQLTLLRELVGQNPEQTAKLLDQSCGKMPKRLESFQQRWKKCEPQLTSWRAFFDFVGAPASYTKPILANFYGWINFLEKSAKAKGPRYYRFKKLASKIKQKQNNRKNIHNRNRGKSLIW